MEEKSAQYFTDKLHARTYPDRNQIKNDIVGLIKKNFVGTYDLVQAAIKKAEQDAQAEINRQLENYNDQEGIILDEFKQWLFDNEGTNNAKINELAYSKAWESGHSSGLEDVRYYFTDYIEFAENVLEANFKK